MSVPGRNLGVRDQLAVGASGLLARRMRSALSAVGVAIGIAALVAVLGLSESSKADLVAQLDRLGTNLLTVSPGQTVFGAEARLPAEAEAMIGRVATVEQTAQVATLAEFTVRRSDRVPATETGGLAVRAASLDLTEAVGATVASGRWHDEATADHPTVVLGATAARRLGINDLDQPVSVWIGGRWYSVLGILDPVVLAPELDTSALVGTGIASELYEADLRASTIYVRVDESVVADTRALLAPSADPDHPEQVDVSRPSDALAAQLATKSAFTSLFLGLGAVALLVGAVGIGNVMVISVLERRREIGLRRAIGATRRHIAVQFLTEALLLSGVGGTIGAGLGAVLTVAYAAVRGWQPVVPTNALLVGVLGSLVVGVAAGLYPARRAAALAPTEALRSA